MQFVSSKAVMDFLNRFSLSQCYLVGSSFILATATSGLLVSALLPSQKINSKSKVKTAKPKLSIQSRSILEEDQIKTILDRNLFNHEGTLGDQSDAKAVKKRMLLQIRLVASSLPLVVQGIIFSGNPFTGLAMIKNKSKSTIKSYTVGDEVLNGAKLAKIYESRVILERNGGFEYIDIEKFELKRRRGGAKRKKS